MIRTTAQNTAQSLDEMAAEGDGIVRICGVLLHQAQEPPVTTD